MLMMRLSPPEQLGEFFGLYGLVGKGSQVIGQLLFGVILLVFQPVLGVAAYQIAVLSLLVTMLIGAWLHPAGERPLERLRGSRDRGPAGTAGAGDRAARADGRPAQSSIAASGWRRRQAQAEPIIASRFDRVRTPAQHVGRPIDGRHEDRRVARAPRTDRVRDREPDDALGRLDHLADAEPAAAAEVADERRVRPGVARRGRLEREEVRVGEVGDVDVVADAGPVGRRVVVAEERQLAPRAGGRGEDVGDEVGLGVVVLAERARWRRRR